MKSNQYLVTEFFLLFFFVPISLLFPHNFVIKAGTVLIAFSYLLFVLFKKTSITFKIKKDINWKNFWRSTLVKFLIIGFITTVYVWYINPEALFCVPRTKPSLFVIILLVYTFLSVWPQEVIYRTFFFERYKHLFQDKRLFLFVNAIAFSLAHLFFRNTLVIVLTFIGGLLFGYTYYKTRSTTLVSIEHALYGNWLFTVGMGDMLAFPGMDSCAG